jgi:hypothetical protein
MKNNFQKSFFSSKKNILFFIWGEVILLCLIIFQFFLMLGIKNENGALTFNLE